MFNKSDVKSKLVDLQKWFEDNPKLPQEIDRMLLIRFYKCMNGDVEEVKKLIELNYTMRNKHANLFINRDPEDEKLKLQLKSEDLVPLPGLTPERNKILCYRLNEHDASKFNSANGSKIFFMLADSRFTLTDVQPKNAVDKQANNANDIESLADMADGDIQIFDITGYTLAHMRRISLSTLRTYMKFLQEAYPVRLRALHVINCPSYINKMIAIVRPFIRDDVCKMIHIHTTDLESLYKCVPRDMLPEEYGGKAGKMSDLKQQWLQILYAKRNYLMDLKQWKVTEPEKQTRWSWF